MARLKRLHAVNAVWQVVTVGANGSVKLWDTTSRDGFPIASFEGHKEDVATVDWSITRKDSFVTGGWDRAVHVRHPHATHTHT